MGTALWIAQVVLAAAFAGAGIVKLSRSRAELAEMGMGFVEDLSDPSVRAIGVVELVGAVGLVLPPVVDVAPVLTPVAALGLVVTMAAAGAVHVRRGEPGELPKNLALGAVALFVVWGRFGPYAF